MIFGRTLNLLTPALSVRSAKKTKWTRKRNIYVYTYIRFIWCAFVATTISFAHIFLRQCTLCKSFQEHILNGGGE